MVAVTAYHPLQQVNMHIIDAAEPVLLDYQEAEGIASVQHLGSHRIVA